MNEGTVSQLRTEWYIMTKLSHSVSMPAPICQSSTQKRKVRRKTGGEVRRRSIVSEVSGYKKIQGGLQRREKKKYKKTKNHPQKLEQSKRSRQGPVSTVRPAFQIYQIVSPLSFPGDQPVWPLAPSPQEVRLHQYLGSLCSYSDSLLHCSD